MTKKKDNKARILQKELNKVDGFNLKIASKIKKSDKLKTGIFALDYILDGGISQDEGGHRIEFYGAESSCKTTFTMHLIKRYQELGKLCLFVDAERSWDSAWAKKLGINEDELLIATPENLEKFGDITSEVIPKLDLIVVDSVVSMIPQVEEENLTEKQTMGLMARINAQITRKIYAALGVELEEEYEGAQLNPNTTIIFINQMREKIGILYGNPETTGGGRALKHLYQSRVKFRRGQKITEGKDTIGTEINLQCTKNKRGKPNRVAQVDFKNDGTIDNQKSLLHAAIKYGLILRAGAYFTFDSVKEKGQDNFCKAMTDKNLWNKMEELIWENIH